MLAEIIDYALLGMFLSFMAHFITVVFSLPLRAVRALRRG